MFYLFKKPKNTLENNMVKELADICKTPWRLAFWIWHRIWYETDLKQYGEREHYAIPRTTLINMKGDCDDIMWLAHDTLKFFDDISEIHMVGVTKSKYKKGHGVCAFVYKGTWYYIDTIKMIKKCKKAKQVDDIPEYVYKDWWMHIYFKVIDGKLKQVRRRYRNVNL